MLLNVVMVGDRELVAQLDEMPAIVRQILKAKITSLALRLEALIKDKLSNKVLNVQTGALRRSIFYRVDDRGQLIVATVGSSGDVKYAAIHEFGGQTPPHDIVPRKAEALSFVIGGKRVFAKIVHHPGSKMPERSYIRSSLADLREQIVLGLRQGVAEGVASALKVKAVV